jgi:ABC-2 type transport system permease protein
MSSFLALLKVELKNYFAQSNANLGVGNKKTLLYIALGFLGITFMSMSYQLTVSLYSAFNQIGQPELTFTTMFFITSMAILFLSFSALIHLFYYSKNTGFLLTLPIKENIIIFARLAVQYIYSLMITAVFLIPCLVVIYTKQGLGLISILGGFIVLVLTPLVPLLITTLLIVLIMNKASKFVSKRAITIITNVILIAFILGIQMLIIRQTESSDFVLDLLLSDSGLLYYFGLRFPPSVWATRMVNGSLLNTIFYLGLNGALFALASVIIAPLVRSSLQDFQQGESKVKSKKGKLVQSSQLKTLVNRNVAIVMKTPAFLMNVAILVLLPFIIVGINMMSGQFSLSQMQQLLGEFANSEFAVYIPLILAAIYILPAFMGSFAATAITREGKFLWQVRVVPVSAELDIKARIVSCFIFSIVGVLILIPITFILLPISIFQIIFALVLAVIAIMIMLQIDILIDINRPILDWNSPTQAVKNNMNVLLALAWRVGVIIVGYITISALRSFGFLSINILISAVLLIMLLVSNILFKKGIEKYRKLEV